MCNARNGNDRENAIRNQLLLLPLSYPRSKDTKDLMKLVVPTTFWTTYGSFSGTPVAATRVRKLNNGNYVFVTFVVIRNPANLLQSDVE